MRSNTHDKKRVLVIAYAFWPMNIVGAVRPTHVVSRLAQKGYEPVVLTTVPWDKAITDPLWAADFVKSAKIYRTAFFLPAFALRKARRIVLPWLERLIDRYSRSRGICRLLRLLEKLFDSFIVLSDWVLDEPLWNVGIIFTGLRVAIMRNVDCVFCTVPPGSSLAFAALLARIIRTPLVTDFRDLWTLHEYRDLREEKLTSKVARAAERYALLSSASVIYNTATAKELMDSQYPGLAPRTLAIPNGIQFERNGQCKDFKKSKSFTICHIGSLYADRDATDFLTGLKQWIQMNKGDFEGKITVRFVGRGSGRILGTANTLNVTRFVEVHGHKPKHELLGLLSEADLFLLFLGYRPQSAYVVPAKFYDYLAMERPILAFAPENGEVCKLMNELGLSDNVVTQPDPDKVSAVLTREYARAQGKGERFAVPAELKARYAYSSIAERIGKVIEKSVEEN